jgi:23S rRNA (uracil1939-C5)-methyltransferase
MSKPQLIPPVRNNQRLELTIGALASGGEGITHHEGYTLFVPTGLPGDTVSVEVVKTTPRFGVTRVLRRLADSPDRIPSPCPAFPRCGGCSLLSLNYGKQMEFKVQTVVEALVRIGKAELPEEIETLPADQPLFYRNKASFAVQGKSGNPRIGFYRVGTHAVEDSMFCETLLPPINTIKEWIRGLLTKHGTSIYDEKRHKGFLRGLVVRHSPTTRESLLGIVTCEGEIPSALVGDLVDGAEKLRIVGIVQNINPLKTNVILGETQRTLWGRAYLLDRLGDLEFRVSLNSFFQVNPFQTEKLYDLIRAWTQPQGKYVVDAYCGTGAIALWLARAGARVAGIEEMPTAVEDARHNAALNNIEQCEFHCGALENEISQFGADSGIDVLVVDPPRKGLDESVFPALSRISPERIIYVSCNPATLARDISRLTEYRIHKLCVVDMFPQTAHVEAVVLLEKR